MLDLIYRNGNHEKIIARRTQRSWTYDHGYYFCRCAVVRGQLFRMGAVNSPKFILKIIYPNGATKIIEARSAIAIDTIVKNQDVINSANLKGRFWINLDSENRTQESIEGQLA